MAEDEGALSKARGMKRTKPAETERQAGLGPVPEDVRTAIHLMRAALCRSLSVSELCKGCGVPERTLNQHFRGFVGIPPIRYLRRLRLAAAREALLSGGPGTSVTEIARRYQFNHAGRFSEEYRQRFGETPSATLRRARAARLKAAASEEGTAKDRERDSGGPAPALASREKPSIAIMLGAVSTPEASLRWLAESAAEAVAADLCANRTLAVVLPRSTHAAMHDPSRVARESGARYLLTGRLLRDGTRLRFILRVTEAAGGHHLWGDSFDGEVDQPLALHDRIVRGVRRGIVRSIRGAEIERAYRRAPRDLDAYGLAMRALPLLYCSTLDAVQRALDIVNRAIEIDPDYGLATALAAWGHGQLVMYNATSDPAAQRDRSRRLSRRAAILDDDDPLALTTRCAVHMMLGELEISEILVTRALAGDPTSALAWGRSGWLHSYRGASRTAIEHFRHALRLGPDSSRANIFAGIGSAHFNAGRYGEAASWIRRAMREQPGLAWANRSLSVSYSRLGDWPKARESLDELRRFQPDLTVSQVVAAVPFRPDFLDRLGDGLSALGLPP